MSNTRGEKERQIERQEEENIMSSLDLVGRRRGSNFSSLARSRRRFRFREAIDIECGGEHKAERAL